MADSAVAAAITERSEPAVALRPLALPVEHGGWALLLEPIVLALLVAPSWPGVAIGIFCVAVFLARQPLRLGLTDRMRGRRYPRTAICERLFIGYGSVAFVAMIAAVAQSEWKIVLPLVAVAPLILFQFAHDLRRRAREAAPEIMGAIAAAAPAAAIAMAASRSGAIALGLVAIALARNVSSVVYVRMMFRRASRPATFLVHLGAIVLAMTAVVFGPAPITAVIAMALLMLRFLLMQPAPARVVGLREIAFGVATVALSVAGHWPG